MHLYTQVLITNLYALVLTIIFPSPQSYERLIGITKQLIQLPLENLLI